MMTPQRYQRVKEAFGQACDATPADRAVLLARWGAEDPALRSEIELLLAHDQQGGAEASNQGESVRSSDRDMSRRAALPELIGDYRVLDVLGEGGMGIVYLAEQNSPRRQVALKVIRSGLITPGMHRRFEHESQLLGRLRHPNIAQVFEARTAADGQAPGSVGPYFAMELVRGEPLIDYADHHRLSTRQRLALMIQVCDAVEHAHQKGVMHRDLKPSNIVVETSAAGGVPKVLDFGVARATDADMSASAARTDVGQLIGTVPYMSPEQAGGDPHELDTRSDVYSLGVVLYELLAGRLPYDLSGRPLSDALRVISEANPTPLSSVNRVFRGDLETIVAKSLEKDRARRYQSASSLKADLEHYVRDEPIDARPSSPWYQFRKFAHRNKAIMSGIMVAVLSLMAAVAMSSMSAVQASRQRDEAIDAGQRAELAASTAQQTQHFLEAMLASVDPDVAQGRDISVLREMLDHAAEHAQAELSATPQVLAAIRLVIGTTYMQLGLYPEAEPHLRAAVNLRRDLHGDKHPEVAEALNGLGELLRQTGRDDEAEPLLREALALRIEQDGERSMSAAGVLNNLGLLLMHQSLHEASDAALSLALEVRRERMAADDPAVIESVQSLAGLRLEQGRLLDAEQLLRDVLAANRQRYGERHPRVALSLHNLGGVLATRGELRAAEATYREALDLGRVVLGEEHPRVATTLVQLANVLVNRGEITEAQQAASQALAIRRKAFGDRHSSVAQAQNVLVMILLNQRQYAAAEPLARQSVELISADLGPNHRNTAGAMHTLAQTLAFQQKNDEAATWYRQALVVFTERLGADHPTTSRCKARLGSALRIMQDNVAAEPLLLEAVAVMRAVMPRHTETVDALFDLGSLKLDAGRAAEAEPLFRECLATARQVRPPGFWKTAETAGLLGAALTQLGGYAEAEPLVLECRERMKEIGGGEDKMGQNALRRVIELYESWGKPDQAEPYKAQLTEPAPGP